MHSRYFHNQSNKDTQLRRATAYFAHLREELGERAALRTAAAAVHLPLGIKAMPGEEELNGIFLSVVLSLRHLYHSLPCTNTNRFIPSCFALDAYSPTKG
jgi:hypothetical protein